MGFSPTGFQMPVAACIGRRKPFASGQQATKAVRVAQAFLDEGRKNYKPAGALRSEEGYDEESFWRKTSPDACRT